MTINEVKPITEKDRLGLLNYEKWIKKYKETVINAVDEIPCVKTSGYDCYIWGTQDDIIWIIRPRNIEDIKALNIYSDIACYPYLGSKLTEDDIGKVLRINLGIWGQSFYVERLSDYLKKIEQKYNELADELDKILIGEEYV